MRLDVISGRMSILSMRIRISPGNESIMMVSGDGFVKRHKNPSNNPRKTKAMVNARSKLLRMGPQKLEQH